jgi:hypothetical protein
VKLWPAPDAVYGMTMIYRVEPTAITGLMMTDPGSVTISALPTAFVGVVALNLAARLAMRQPERAAALRAEYDAEMAKAQDRIAEVLARNIDARGHDPEEFAAGLGASIGRRGYTTRRI